MDGEVSHEKSRAVSDGAPPAEVDARIEDIADKYLDEAQAGRQPDRVALAAAYPELAPWLEARLRLLDGLRRVGDGAERTVEVRCPHCGQAMPVAARGQGTATCSSCGSAFRVDAGHDGSAPESLPDAIGRFQVIALLGRGAFGAVYEAFDPDLGRAVAVKVPRAGYFAAPGDEDRFLREARHTAQLKHPSIVRVHEIGYERGLPFIVSDLIDGSTLGERLAEARPSFREAADLVAQVADALEYAHGEKIVHRDIKPQNILIDSEGRPHVTDFGLARRDEGEVTITLDGQILGTPAYMPPEQAAGQLHLVDARSDVYSLGVVLYELLTGRRPFEGSRTRVIQQVLHDEPPAPRVFNDHIPRDLETICLKAIARERPRRYATARAFADDLRRQLRGEPIAARPVGNLERGLRWCRRQPAVASLLGGIVTLLLVTAGVSLAAYLRVEKSLADTQAAESQATKALQSSRDLLVRRNIGEGAARLAAGDPATALLWFLQAFQLDWDDPGRREQHRMRLAAVLDRCPRIERLWFGEGEGLWKSFSDDARRVLGIHTDGCVVYDSGTGKALVRRRDLGWFPTACLSADGKRVAMGREDGAAIVQDIDSGATTELPAQGAAQVAVLAFSPDARVLAVGRKDGAVDLWDVGEKRQLLPALPRYEARIHSLLFSPDGAALFAATQYGQGHLWSLARGEEVERQIAHRGTIAAVAFSADGRQLATGGLDAVARIVPASNESGGEIELRHAEGILDVELSKDGAYALTASSDRTARLWLLPAGAPAGPPMVHDGSVLQARLRYPGPTVVTASMSGVVRRWNPFTGKEVAPPLWHADAVRLVAFSPGGDQVFTACFDNSLRVWQLPGPPRGLRSIELGGPCTAARLIDGGQTLLVMLRGDKARAIRLDTLQPALPDLELPPQAQFLAAGEDGRRIWVGSGSGAVRVFDGTTGQSLGDSPAFGAHVSTFIASRDGRRLAIGLIDGRVWVWIDGKPRHALAHGAQVLHLGFSPDGKLLTVSANGTGQVKVWDVESGALVRALEQFPSGGGGPYMGRVVSVSSFSPDGRSVLTSDSSGRVKLWDTTSWELRRSIHTHQYFLYRTGFSGDGAQFATAAMDGTARVWRTEERGGSSTLIRHDHMIEAITFNDDGSLFATASRDTKAAVWSARTGEPLGPPLEHESMLIGVDFRPGRRELVTCSGDGKVRVWSIAQGEEPTEALLTLAQLLACRAPDAHGSLEPLSPEEIKAMWERLNGPARE